MAVCLLPGTEVAFEHDVALDNLFGVARQTVPARVARFRQVDMHEPRMHHDALEFPDGRLVLVTRLVDGQRATVLQLPAPARTPKAASERGATEPLATGR